MRFTTATAAALALVLGHVAGPAAAQQGTAPDTTEMEVEGNLPEGSLAEERAGAIGDEPEAVRQGDGEAHEADEAAAPDGTTDENILLQRREGAIGDDPEPVVQGDDGGEGSREAGKADTAGQ